MEKECKLGPGFVMRKSASERTVTGVFSITGVRDLGNDVMVAGSMAASLKKTLPVFQWNHDDSQPPTAVVLSAMEIDRKDIPADILKEAPGATSAAVVTRRYLHNDLANSIFEALMADSPLQMSFTYTLAPEDADYKNAPDGVRERWIKRTTVLEICDCPLGLNPHTRSNIGKKGFTYAGGISRNGVSARLEDRAVGAVGPVYAPSDILVARKAAYRQLYQEYMAYKTYARDLSLRRYAEQLRQRLVHLGNEINYLEACEQGWVE